MPSETQNTAIGAAEQKSASNETPGLQSEVKFECPKCGQHIATSRESAGVIIACPNCNGQITIPKLAQFCAVAAPLPTPLKRGIVGKIPAKYVPTKIFGIFAAVFAAFMIFNMIGYATAQSELDTLRAKKSDFIGSAIGNVFKDDWWEVLGSVFGTISSSDAITAKQAEVDGYVGWAWIFALGMAGAYGVGIIPSRARIRTIVQEKAAGMSPVALRWIFWGLAGLFGLIALIGIMGSSLNALVFFGSICFGFGLWGRSYFNKQSAPTLQPLDKVRANLN